MRRLITLFAAGTLLAGLAGPVLAFDSGGTPTVPGSDSVTWTGQGASDGALDTTICAPDAGAEQNGSYLLWILTTDGGSIVDGSAVLRLGGDATAYAATNAGGSWHVITPYVTPDASLTAEASFEVTRTGTGAWNLVISHGCATAEDPPGKDLTVAATATTAFTRTYEWSLAKSVDRTRVAQIGGSALFRYEVSVAQTGWTDSAWTATGTITVHNPNATGVALTGVTATVDSGGSCTVTGDKTQTVAAGSDSSSLGYTCTYAVAPDPLAGTATVTVTWDAAAAGTPTGSAGGTAAVSFGEPTTLVNGTATVTDSVEGLLGTLTASATAPAPSAVYEYARTIAVPTWDCAAYDNVATIVETERTAGVTVEVCGPARTGALTIGFWQNRNGQGIISGGSAPSGVCASGTWLRGYAPFQDLSSSASCTKVASYVAGVIKAANASGSSMNAMLKAQDLAVSLDIFFSDPALGGNAISAPAPVGGIAVDLTTICAMTGGAGSKCSGTFVDVSDFFGAQCLTVNEIVALEAASSNPGGGVWFGQVKRQQEIAKNVDDAIANQVVFACP